MLEFVHMFTNEGEEEYARTHAKGTPKYVMILEMQRHKWTEKWAEHIGSNILQRPVHFMSSRQHRSVFSDLRRRGMPFGGDRDWAVSTFLVAFFLSSARFGSASRNKNYTKLFMTISTVVRKVYRTSSADTNKQLKLFVVAAAVAAPLLFRCVERRVQGFIFCIVCLCVRRRWGYGWRHVMLW